jgi:hypothetical protein
LTCDWILLAPSIFPSWTSFPRGILFSQGPSWKKKFFLQSLFWTKI